MEIDVFWKEQPCITLYHGTSTAKAEQIAQQGFRVSEKGHTAGRTYFSSSIEQAWAYAAVGGEVDTDFSEYSPLPIEQRAVIIVEIDPALLEISGGGVFKTKELWLDAKETIERLFADEEPTLEFSTTHNIPADAIYEIIRRTQ